MKTELKSQHKMVLVPARYDRVEEEVVTLTMTRREAEILRSITGLTITIPDRFIQTGGGRAPLTNAQHAEVVGFLSGLGAELNAVDVAKAFLAK